MFPQSGDQFTLDFYLPVSGEARLELFDLTGRKISTIADKRYASGWYTVDVPAGNLDNGIYICKLSSGNMNTVLKLEIQQ